MSKVKTAVDVVLGAAGFGEEGAGGTRVSDFKDIATIVDVFQAHGHTEADTARLYASGTSEKVLSKLDLPKRGIKIDTKYFATAWRDRNKGLPASELTTYQPADLRKYMDTSLEALGVDQVDLWYLHGPERTTPFEVTLKGVNELYKEGKFKRFGISNFASWEVAEIVEICKANGYVQPSVYQGVYNAIHRKVEPELFPCLRKYGISLYAFNPLAGGFFTGQYKSMNVEVEPGSRFDPKGWVGQMYRARYWKEAYFKALDTVDAVASKHGLTLAEVAFRWLAHHSYLKRDYGDKIIIGVSSVKHIEVNLSDLEKGPLPGDVVTVLDQVWLDVQSSASNYFHP